MKDFEHGGARTTLQLSEDMAFLRNTWRWQRIGWLCMAALIVAATLGAFGRGPIASAEVSATGILSARYERLVREQALTDTHIEAAPRAITNGRFELMIDREFLAGMQIVEIQPQPVAVTALPTGLLFRFTAAYSNDPLAIRFTLRPVSAGSQTARLWMADGTALRLQQFVFP